MNDPAHPISITVFPGDGIGPEITRATLEVLRTLDRRFRLNLEFPCFEVGLERLRKEGSTFPPALLEEARKAKGVLLGPISHAIYPSREEGGINVSSALRIGLDLYGNIRPSRTRPGIPHWGRTPMDLVIVRENTEGFYADRNMAVGPGELMPTPDVAISLRKVTAQGSRRIARCAAELAAHRKRKKLTAVHKANVLRVSEPLFLNATREAAAEFGLEYDEQLVDSMAALLVRDPQRFDVVVTTNMFGDILSDEAAELSGSLGLGASINCGDEHVMAQAQHGSAPDIAGQDRANPVSLILSAAMMLEWIGRRENRPALCRAGEALETAVDQLLAEPESRTADLGGSQTTSSFTEKLCARLACEEP
ncbi:MAG TPA: isocitrate/isopropylmalate dehydrogenase family protein [Chthoniobacteraceae bacterium]|nr:isocitrate/isopropylmalate dehydrogenase family protein [Chthoniobacteraceae bacterium]